MPPSHVQQHVCVSQLRASHCLIRPYLPVRQQNKRIFKEDISLFHSAELLYADTVLVLTARVCEGFVLSLLRDTFHLCKCISVFSSVVVKCVCA